MDKKPLLLLASIILGILFICSVSSATETPAYMILLQGTDSTLEEANDTLVLTLKETIPYAVFLTEKSYLKPIESSLSLIKKPIPAAVVMKGDKGESTSMVLVSNPVFSEDTHRLTLTLQPQKFYEGTVLSPFVDPGQNDITDDPGAVTLTKLYLEMNENAPENCCPPGTPPGEVCIC